MSAATAAVVGLGALGAPSAVAAPPATHRAGRRRPAGLAGRHAADHGFPDLELEPGTEPFTPNPVSLLPGRPRR